MMDQTSKDQMPACDPGAGIVGRREFLKLSGAAMVALTLPSVLRVPGRPYTYMAQRAEYERRLIGSLRGMRPGDMENFSYPWDDAASTNFLVMLNEEAGGGVGQDRNVVAFNSWCTHQGGPLAGTVSGEVGTVGPCPLHLTTFDLSRHGMVVSGHATLGLPQVVLEADGDDIYATGMQGLIYGYHDNLGVPSR